MLKIQHIKTHTQNTLLGFKGVYTLFSQNIGCMKYKIRIYNLNVVQYVYYIGLGKFCLTTFKYEKLTFMVVF